MLPMVQLDDIDRKLLELLQQDDRIPLSRPSVASRSRRRTD
jgi:DNA-binding Lrp family transcriptional regulator